MRHKKTGTSVPVFFVHLRSHLSPHPRLRSHLCLRLRDANAGHSIRAKLKDLLAHSSLKQTETYMGSFDTYENDKALEDIFAAPQPNPGAELIVALKSMTPEEITALLSQVRK